MFNPNKKYEITRSNLKRDYIRYSPSKISTTITANRQKYYNIPRAVSVISSLNSYLEFSFEVFKKIGNSRYANSIDIRLINLALTALFGNFNLTTSRLKI